MVMGRRMTSGGRGQEERTTTADVLLILIDWRVRLEQGSGGDMKSGGPSSSEGKRVPARRKKQQTRPTVGSTPIRGRDEHVAYPADHLLQQ